MTHINALYRQVFGPLDILRTYAAENRGIPSWKWCICEFNESKQQQKNVK